MSATVPAGMSKIKNGGLDQYGAEPFNLEQLALKGLTRQTQPDDVTCLPSQRPWPAVKLH